MPFRRILLLVAALALLLPIAACDDARHDSTPDSDPVLGWSVRSSESCATTPDEVRAQAKALVEHGLRDLGYRTLVVPCDRDLPALREPGLGKFVADQGMTLRVVKSDSRLARSVIPAFMPRVEPLRTAVTRQVMNAEPVVFSGDVGALNVDNLAVVTNSAVPPLALDDRGAAGSEVAGDSEVWSRAVGETGLLVSLTNGSGAPRRVSVAIDELNLAGDDSVPATDLWTGQRIVADDGRLGVYLEPGDSALLRIG